MNIFQELVTMALQVIQIMLSVFPDADQNKLDTIGNTITSVNGTIASANYYLPMELLATYITIIISIEGSILLFKSVNWLVNKVRGSG